MATRLREKTAVPAARAGRVWVVPNRRTLGLFAVLLAMCYAGASQSNGAAYLLCFVVTGLALVSLVHAWANLRGLAVSVETIPPVFAGEEVLVAVTVTSTNGRTHFGIRLVARRGPPPLRGGVVHPHTPSRFETRFPAEIRGHHHHLELELNCDYPLGFFTARQLITVTRDYYIYPAPHGAAPWPRTLAPTRHPREGTRHEGDDFGGTRMWRQGESQRHIDWKAAARSPVLLTKQWSGEVDEILRFDWAALPSLEEEARLSQLTRWVVAAEHGFATYELRLPGRVWPASRGDKHYHECLRALAEFTAPSAESFP